MRDQNIDRKVHQVSSYSGVDSFLDDPHGPAGIISILENGVPIDILNSPKGSKVTAVFFHGAIENHHKLPYLVGSGISTGLDMNRIFLSDPALYLTPNLLLSWYTGSHAQPKLQQQLTEIISKLHTTAGGQRIVFFGGSGGGFASLYFASQFPGSVAVVFNPQTNIAQYQSRAIHSFTHNAFKIADTEYDPLSLLPEHIITNVLPAYSAPLDVTVAYMQNLNDPAHVSRHMAPFLESVHPDNTVLVLKDHWTEGHTPPPKDLMVAALEAATMPSWVAELQALGFAPA